MNIKKKLLALSAVLAIFASFAGCSDKGDSGSSTADNGNSSSVAENDNNGNNDNDAKNDNADNNNSKADDAENVFNDAIKNEELSPEELDEITKQNLEIKPYTPGNNGVVQDAVESTPDSAGNANAQAGNNADANNAQAGNNAATTATVAENELGNNNADLPGDTKLEVHNGTRTIMQAWWMDISKGQDYIFNGEYLTAEFKIKEGTADGIYPVTLDWLDFSTWEATTVEFTGIDGAVVVGAEATENKFNEDGTPQVMVQNVSGKPGETVKVSIHIKNNPGVVANLLRFSYNSDVLEYVGGGEGADFDGEFK